WWRFNRDLSDREDLMMARRGFGLVGALWIVALGGCASGGGGPGMDVIAGPGVWRLLEADPGPTQRHENGYVRIGSRFYLVGGRGDRPVEIYDPATGTWSRGAVPPMEIHHFQAVEYDGKIYAVGAMTGRYPTEPPIPAIQI